MNVSANANPFTPNFGQIPEVFAGREDIRHAAIEALEYPWGHPNQTTIIIGARGTGKTALLRSILNEAEQRGWIAASVTCLNGMLEDILQQAYRRGSALTTPEPTAVLTGLGIGQLINAEWTPTQTGELNWRSRISNLLDELAEHDAGLLLVIDEVDPDLDEMVQLAAVYQQLVGENRKIALFMAGLPHRVSRLLTNKSVSFLRRAAQHRLESLSPSEVSDAFRATVDKAGKSIPDSALEDAVDAIDGFPYMMQLVGYRAWQAASEESSIEDAAVLEGAQRAENDMRTRVLQSTLDELSSKDLEFLNAMLEDDDVTRADAIAERLGRSSAHVATYRRRLLEQGVIADLGRTSFKFALPGLRDYLPEYLTYNL